MKKIQLSIPEPCHENWDAMSATQQGRYCNACAKEVIDFSNMSDTDVLNYFLAKKKNDKVCGRAYPDQLDRNITALPQRKKYWQWQYILTAVLFFMKPAKTKAQGLMVPFKYESNTIKLDYRDKEIKQSGRKNTITGVVKDEEGKPVPYASVKVAGTVVGAVANEQGQFSLEAEVSAKALEISSLNYETREALINEKEIVLKKKVKVMDEVVIQSENRTRRMGGMAGGISVCKISRTRIIGDTIKSWINTFNPSIKIYPNPVIKGNTFNIKMKLKQTGSHTIQVMDAAGKLLKEKKINAPSKEWDEQFTTSSTWSAGMYSIKVTDESGKSISTGKLVIQ